MSRRLRPPCHAYPSAVASAPTKWPTISRGDRVRRVRSGGRLPSEKELMERFGVGRPAVREALFILQQQGLVEIASGARARVTAPIAKLPDRTARRSGQAHRRDRQGPGPYGAGAAAVRSRRRLAGGAAARRTRTSPAASARSTPTPPPSATRRVHPHRRGVPLRADGDRAQPDLHGHPRGARANG